MSHFPHRDDKRVGSYVKRHRCADGTVLFWRETPENAQIEADVSGRARLSGQVLSMIDKCDRTGFVKLKQTWRSLTSTCAPQRRRR